MLFRSGHLVPIAVRLSHQLSPMSRRLHVRSQMIREYIRPTESLPLVCLTICRHVVVQCASRITIQHVHKNAVIPISCKTSPTSAPKSWSVSVVGSCRCLKKLRMSCEPVATGFSGLFAGSFFSCSFSSEYTFLKHHCLCLVWVVGQVRVV